jgi:ComF family protein
VPALSQSVRSHVRGICEALASIVFPAPCRVCGGILDTGARIPFCRACVEALSERLPEPLCARCGRPVVSAAAAESLTQRECHLCRSGVYHFDHARSFGPYTPKMARGILQLKYADLTPLGGWFARKLAAVVEREPALFAADVVVPVPLDRGRMRERGYNQAELIARPFARLMGIPFRSYLLVRTRPRPNQLRLTRRERWDTVRGAYATQKAAQVDKMSVILVDDVFTTGATLDACSNALKEAGAARVVGLTVARALLQSPAPDAGLQDRDLGNESTGPNR